MAPLTVAEEQRICALHKRGESIKVITHETGRSEASIYRTLHKHGVELRNYAVKAKTTNPRNAQIAALYDLGLTMPQIGEMHGISRERVRQILNEVSPTEERRNKASEKAPALMYSRHCRICNKPFETTHFKKETCDTVCSKLARYVHERFDPHRYAVHELGTMRWMIAHPDRVLAPSQLEWAKQGLAIYEETGKIPRPSRRFFFGKTYDLLLERAGQVKIDHWLATFYKNFEAT